MAVNPECQCYTSFNLNTGKDEHTLSRECPVHQNEAQAYYAELDAKVARTSGARHDLESVICKAIRIAVEVHGAQRDKQGQPYFYHLARVAMALDTEIEQVCGWLHDVLEDSPNASQWVQVFECEFPDEVLDCCVALWHKKGEPYGAYIERCAALPLARKVKIADIRDNLKPKRLEQLDSATQHRLLAKYVPALKRLEAQP